MFIVGKLKTGGMTRERERKIAWSTLVKANPIKMLEFQRYYTRKYNGDNNRTIITIISG